MGSRDKEEPPLSIRTARIRHVCANRLGQNRHAAVLVEAEQSRNRRLALDRDWRGLHWTARQGGVEFATWPATANDARIQNVE